MHVENLVWILADDSDTCNPVLDNLLDTFGKCPITAMNSTF